jgi:multiple sugar transport system substrate-binding protein
MKIQRRRFWGIILSLIMCMALFSGCEKNSGKKKTIKLIIKCPTLMMNSVVDEGTVDAQHFLEQAGAAFAAQYEKADVTIDVQVFDYVDEVEAVSESFDTDSAMDVLYEDYFNMSSYIYTGRVVPLDDIITDSIRDDIDQSYWEQSTVEGRTYMMPYLSRQNVLMYNKKLMSECGLDSYISDTEIQSWTTDQWDEILDTLAGKLPDGVYPMMMYGKNNQGDTHTMSVIRAFGSEIFDENGNFDFESEEAVKALAWIQDGVGRGWFPPHSENLEIADNQELFDNDQLVFYVFNSANASLYDNLSNYGFVNFPGNTATSFVTGFEVFDNGDDDKVQVAKDFVRYIYENDKWLELSAGNIPVSERVAEKYSNDIAMYDQFADNAENVVDYMNSSPNWQGSETAVRSVFWKSIHKLLQGTATPEECAAQLDESCNSALIYGRENSKLHD